MPENPYKAPATIARPSSPSPSETAAKIVSLILYCVPLASAVGGLTFAIAFDNISGFGDSGLMIASLVGFTTGGLAALVAWAFCRSRVNRGGLHLRDLVISDIAYGVAVVVAVCPFALAAAIAVLHLMPALAETIEPVIGETVAGVVCFSIPAFPFFAMELSGMQATLEWRLSQRDLSRG